MKIFPIARKNNLVVQESGEELLAYDLQNNKAFCLNETSTMVWRLCDGKNSAREISRKMSTTLKTTVNEDLVGLALNQLHKKNLIKDNYEADNYFSGRSRREAIRTLGFTSLIALPLISSIVAPEAIMAQSMAACGMLNDNCTSIPDTCCPGQGLQCTGTQNGVAGVPGVTPGGSQCCTGGGTDLFTPGSTYCSGGVCAPGACCSGSNSVIAPDPACPVNTCRCN